VIFAVLEWHTVFHIPCCKGNSSIYSVVSTSTRWDEPKSHFCYWELLSVVALWRSSRETALDSTAESENEMVICCLRDCGRRGVNQRERNVVTPEGELPSACCYCLDVSKCWQLELEDDCCCFRYCC